MRLNESDLFEPVPEDGDNFPVCGDDLLVRSTDFVILDRDYKRERGQFLWRYEITFYTPGVVRIPPLEIRWGAQTFSTEAATLEVTTTRAANDEELRPDFGRVPKPWPWGFLLKTLFWILLFMAAWAYWRHRRRHAVPLVPEVPAQSDLDWFLERLAELKREAERHPTPSHVDALTSTIREYLERKNHRPIRSWTRKEMVQGLTLLDLSTLWKFWERYDQFQFSEAKELPGPLLKQGIECTEQVLVGKGGRNVDSR